MAKKFAKKFYHSQSWIRCRASYIATRRMIDGGVCQRCGERTGYIVDHIKELTPSNINDSDVALNHKNLQYLCLPCHNTKTFKNTDEEPIRFDEEGQPLPPTKR